MLLQHKCYTVVQGPSDQMNPKAAVFPTRLCSIRCQLRSLKANRLQRLHGNTSHDILCAMVMSHSSLCAMVSWSCCYWEPLSWSSKHPCQKVHDHPSKPKQRVFRGVSTMATGLSHASLGGCGESRCSKPKLAMSTNSER